MTQQEFSRRRVMQAALALSVAGGVELVAPGGASAASGQTPGLPPDKVGLRLLNDRPLNAETLPQYLDANITPAAHLFVRNNGLPPQDVDAHAWTLRVDGEAARSARTYTLSDLRRRFTPIGRQLTLECGGNGRMEFEPGVPGNQWSLGAVGCPSWQGIRLADVLDDVGVGPDAVYLGYHSADTHLSGDAEKDVISRGIPIHKALADDVMLAWGMNDQALPPLHGYPLRLVVGGWPGSTSGKWLTRLRIRDRVHDGAKMGGKSYRVPRYPVAPGASVLDEDMQIIEAMPIKSLITSPATALQHRVSSPLKVNGHAWVGDATVARVDVSQDFGATWQATDLDAPANHGAWQQWRAMLRFEQPGYYEVWARATDNHGRAQPMVIPGWNPKGYLNNACHRIAVHVV
ncbi:MAG: sulfite oxidase [Pseudomonadota bacterium]